MPRPIPAVRCDREGDAVLYRALTQALHRGCSVRNYRKSDLDTRTRLVSADGRTLADWSFADHRSSMARRVLVALADASTGDR